MHIVVHVRGYYDWQPVPADTEVTPQDIAANRVRPSSNGGYNMRVQCNQDTHVTVGVSEASIIATIIHAYTENGKCGAVLTRAEAVARLLATQVMPLHAHPKWFKEIECNDDTGPDEKLFMDTITPHLDADHGRAPGKNIEPDDLDDLRAAYMTPFDADDHVDHLHKHFKVKTPSATKEVK